MAGDPVRRVAGLYAQAAYAPHLPLPTGRHLIQQMIERDPWLAFHSGQVAHYSSIIAAAAALPAGQTHSLQIASQLHDVGKVATRRSFRPDDHPILGEYLCLAAGLNKEIRLAVRHHHEWFDGSGSPDGLAGDEIPLLARIIAVADTYAHLVAQRPVRSSQSLAVLQVGLRRLRGRKLDPKIVDLWLTRCWRADP